MIRKASQQDRESPNKITKPERFFSIVIRVPAHSVRHFREKQSGDITDKEKKTLSQRNQILPITIKLKIISQGPWGRRVNFTFFSYAILLFLTILVLSGFCHYNLKPLPALKHLK